MVLPFNWSLHLNIPQIQDNLIKIIPLIIKPVVKDDISDLLLGNKFTTSYTLSAPQKELITSKSATLPHVVHVGVVRFLNPQFIDIRGSWGT